MVQAIVAMMLLRAEQSAGTPPAIGEAAPITGIWRGTSKCTVSNSPCQDEENVYRITAAAGKPARYRILGSKIEGGAEIPMGPPTLWYFDLATQTLTYAVGNGHFWLKVDGDQMDGGLMLADMTVYRKIHLERATTTEGSKQ
ncbi:hypothetical protein DYQ86_05625 [Acidobacteria bacterium AB60]|nr:hypothetical protein DYQ86_05625 [Acidobacteria bacterium AB60]